MFDTLRAPVPANLQLFPIFRFILIVALAVQLVRLIWTLVTPVEPLGDWQLRTANVLPLEARATLLARFDAFDRGAAAPTGEAAVTSLDLTLFGLRMNQASGKGSAIVAGSDGVQRSIPVGEEVAPGAVLVDVQFDHIVIERGGLRESLYLDQSIPAETVGGAPATGAQASVSSSQVGTSALTAETLSAAIGIVPRSEGGRVTGLAISAKGDGKVFTQAGFRPGDIISQINGRPVTSASDAASIIQMIKPGARISLMVERGSEALPIALLIPES